MNLSSEPKIIGLANSLNLLEGDPVENVRLYCLERVKGFLRNTRESLTMDRLQAIVCKKLGLKVHWIHHDLELERMTQIYTGKGEIVFATLSSQLTPDAFGVIIQLLRPTSIGEKWVAVIDCRGDKSFRRHWTLWHEISHCLTAVDQMQLPLRRTTDSPRKDPIEVITDLIASDFAFYGPIFDPILRSEVAKNNGELSFSVVSAVRKKFCPEASFQSTLNACVASHPSPCLVLEASLGYKKSEEIAMAAGKGPFIEALRVIRANSNTSGKHLGLWIPPNYRVPDLSIISEALRVCSTRGLSRLENLGTWTDSRGGSLPTIPVQIEAKKSGDHALALMRAA
jgi:hypothetical protein